MSIENQEPESTSWFRENIWRILLIGFGLFGAIFMRFFKKENQDSEDKAEVTRMRERVSSDVK